MLVVVKRATPGDLRRWGTAIGVGTAAGGGGTYAATKDKRKTSGVVAGGLAGQGAYQAAGYATTNYTRARTGQSLRRSDLTQIARGEKKRGLLRADLADKKGWEARMDTRRRHTAAHTTDGKTNWAGVYRNWPKDQPYARASRVIGHTHNGRSGVLLGAAMTLGGAAAGGAAARRRPVRKLYVQDTKASPVRLLESAAGVGLAAWGLGRSPMVGRALGRGLKMARNSNNAYAVEALQRAQSAQGVLGRATAPGERALRSVRAVDQAINRVPRALRPDIALAAGTLLVGHAAPIRQRSYHPVRINIRTRGY